MPADSPWKNMKQAGQRAGGRGARFMRKEAKAGRLRAVQIGGRGELLTRDEWIDAYLESQALPIFVSARRRA